MMRHDLKIEHRWLAPVTGGHKQAEIRRADRDFSVGDELLLYTPDRSNDEIPGYEGDAFVSLSIEPLRRLSGEAVLKELEMGSFG